MKSHEQTLDDICAAMADAWLAACERRVLAQALEPRLAIVIDTQENSRAFGPATEDECRLFVHRAAARDALVAIRSVVPEEAIRGVFPAPRLVPFS
jgi:hypothetical protein